MMLRTSPFADDGWAGTWTIFYWGWWMSWAPFVGMFIARISRGRTVREFVFGVLLATTLIGSLWFTVFGDSGILRQRNDGDMLAADGSGRPQNTTLFHLLDGLPLGRSPVCWRSPWSCSSSSVRRLGLAGHRHPRHRWGSRDPEGTRVYWSVLEGVAAAVLLLVGGAGSCGQPADRLDRHRGPFSIVMVRACVSMLKAFRYELATTPRYLRVSTRAGADGEHVLAAPNADGASRRRPAGVSATLAGLPRSSRAGAGPAPEQHFVVAVHEMPSHAVEVDPTRPPAPRGGRRRAGPAAAVSAAACARAAAPGVAPRGLVVRRFGEWGRLLQAPAFLRTFTSPVVDVTRLTRCRGGSRVNAGNGADWAPCSSKLAERRAAAGRWAARQTRAVPGDGAPRRPQPCLRSAGSGIFVELGPLTGDPPFPRTPSSPGPGRSTGVR